MWANKSLLIHVLKKLLLGKFRFLQIFACVLGGVLLGCLGFGSVWVWKCLSSPEVDKFSVSCWALWANRNDCRHGKGNWTPMNVFGFGSSFFVSFLDAQIQSGGSYGAAPFVLVTPFKWVRED